MAVVGAAFLLAVGRALARIHVEHNRLRRSPFVHLVDPLAGQIGERGKVLGPAEPLRLKPAHLAGPRSVKLMRAEPGSEAAHPASEPRAAWHGLYGILAISDDQRLRHGNPAGSDEVRNPL